MNTNPYDATNVNDTVVQHSCVTLQIESIYKLLSSIFHEVTSQSQDFIDQKMRLAMSSILKNYTNKVDLDDVSFLEDVIVHAGTNIISNGTNPEDLKTHSANISASVQYIIQKNDTYSTRDVHTRLLELHKAHKTICVALESVDVSNILTKITEIENNNIIDFDVFDVPLNIPTRTNYSSSNYEASIHTFSCIVHQQPCLLVPEIVKGNLLGHTRNLGIFDTNSIVFTETKDYAFLYASSLYDTILRINSSFDLWGVIKNASHQYVNIYSDFAVRQFINNKEPDYETYETALQNIATNWFGIYDVDENPTFEHATNIYVSEKACLVDARLAFLLHGAHGIIDGGSECMRQAIVDFSVVFDHDMFTKHIDILLSYWKTNLENDISGTINTVFLSQLNYTNYIGIFKEAYTTLVASEMNALKAQAIKANLYHLYPNGSDDDSSGAMTSNGSIISSINTCIYLGYTTWSWVDTSGVSINHSIYVNDALQSHIQSEWSEMCIYYLNDSSGLSWYSKVYDTVTHQPFTLNLSYGTNNSSDFETDIADAQTILLDIIKEYDITKLPNAENTIYITEEELSATTLGRAWWSSRQIEINSLNYTSYSISNGYYFLLNFQLVSLNLLVIIHEVLHILGIGTDPNGWTNNITNYFMKGTHCFQRYKHILKSSNPNVFTNEVLNSFSGVPIENHHGSGTRGSHFEEGTNDQHQINYRYDENNVEHPSIPREIMSGFLNTGYNFFSDLTLGALEDMGYKVNYLSNYIVNPHYSFCCTQILLYS